MENQIESPVPAGTYADFKAASIASETPPAPGTATEPKPPVVEEEVKPDSSAPPVEKPEGETIEPPDSSKPAPSAPPVKEAKPAETPDESDQDTQEQKEQKEQKHRRDRTAEGKIKELTASQAREKDRADKLEKELETLRTARPAEPKVDPKPEVKAEPVKTPDFTDPKPRLEDYTKYLGSDEPKYAGKSYEALQDMWSDDVDVWNDKKFEARSKREKAEAETQRITAETETKQKSEAEEAAIRKREQDACIEVARDKYDDYDTVINSAIAAHPRVSSDGMMAAFDVCDDLGELRYALAKDGAKEYLRIAAMPFKKAFRETLHLDSLLKAAPVASPEPAAPPEKPKPAVSKVPKPYTPVNGVESPAPKAPTSYKEFKGGARI